MNANKGTRVRSERYLFSGKIRCGVCNQPMTGVTAHGRKGTAYSYYSCRGHRQKACPLKPIKKEMLEETIVSRVLEVLNDDEVVNWIADAVMETQKHENEKNRTAPAVLKAELAEVNKSIDGVMSAIEAGIITSTTKARLEELEAKAEQLKIDISDSELPVPDVDRDFIVYWLTKFRSGSLGDEEAQREFVDSLIFAVRVWNDRAEVVLNYSGDERTIDVLFGGAAETGGGSSKGQNSGEIRC